MRRALLIAILALAVLVDGFFALVNFYPVAPTRSRGPKRRILMALDASQARWLRENLIAEFNDEHNVNLEVQAVDEEALVPELEKGGDDLLLATVPRARGPHVMAQHLVRSFEEVATSDQIAADLDGVVPRVMAAAKLDGKQVFLPRYSLLDVVVYRLSKVRDAVRHWALLRPQIDQALRVVNGRGLPPGYQLELEPEQWDSFDRFVIGYFWAHRRYRGELARGRIAHRKGEVLDGELDIVEGIYRAGASDATLSQTDGRAQLDYFTWETLYREHGLFAQAMLSDPPLDDDGVIEGLRQGDLYLATINQMEAFTLHGGGHPGTPPHIEDPDDLGFAPLMRVSSVELGDGGKPARPGQALAFREDWVWALPSHSPDPQLAYQLVTFLWSRENHYRECEALGTLPLRSDVVQQRSSLFRLVWMDDVFDASFTEWERARPVPDGVEAKWGSVYAQLWEKIVAQRGASGAHPDGIAAILRAPPAPRASPAPLIRPVVATQVDPAAPEDDDDSLDVIDNELWRGDVQLDLPTPKPGEKK